MSAAPAVTPIEELTREERIALAWEAGDLWWKLDAHQLEVYRQYREWEKRPVLGPKADKGANRIFVLDIGRRWGKSALVLLIKDEDCLRQPGTIHTYATAYAKDIKKILVPLQDLLCVDAPTHLCPEYRTTGRKGASAFYFPNGSIIHLVGLDLHPNALRGSGSDGFAISEAAFVTNLAQTISSKILPQFQRRLHARLILESSAPEVIDHDFDKIFVPDAQKRGAYVFATIDDNKAITDEEREAEVSGARAISPENADREYYGKRVRPAELYLVPQFDITRHVKKQRSVTTFARCFVGMDPGMRDKLAILWAHWDYRRAVLRITGEFSKRGAGTIEIAQVCKEMEHRLWRTGHREISKDFTDGPQVHVEGAERYLTPGGLLWKPIVGSVTWWDGEQLQPNPVGRYSDVNLQLVQDLAQEHGLSFSITPKPVGAMEADLNSIRTAFSRDQIELDPSCVETAACLRAARWNKTRTDWERTEEHGHFDLLAALVYLWRNMQRGHDPYPPEHWDKHDILWQQSVLATDERADSDARDLERVWLQEAREWRQ